MIDCLIDTKQRKSLMLVALHRTRSNGYMPEDGGVFTDKVIGKVRRGKNPFNMGCQYMIWRY